MTSTFAPPRGPARWAPPSLGQSPMAAPEPPPRRSRRPVLLATAVVLMAALGVGAVAALTGERNGPGVALPAAQAFDLVSAAESTIAAPTVEFDLSVTAGEIGAVTVSGAIDNESKVASVTTDLSSVLGIGEAMPADTTVDLIVDGASNVVYFSADALGGLLPSESPWISIDLAAIAEATGAPLDETSGGVFLDPSEAAQMLLDADNVTTVGTETIDGVTVEHYQVTVDLADAIAASPQLGTELEDRFDDELSGSGIDVPDTVVYDVWVTEDNQLRRAAVDVTVADQTVSLVLDMTTSTEALDVEIPAESFDITSWLEW